MVASKTSIRFSDLASLIITNTFLGETFVFLSLFSYFWPRIPNGTRCKDKHFENNNQTKSELSSPKINILRIMSKKDMILSLIEHYSDGNKAQFAKLLGITPQGLSTWIKRESFDIELIFSKCEGLSAQWLLTGQGKMLKPNVPDNTPPALGDTDGRALSSDKDKHNYRITQEIGKGIPYFDVDFIGGFNEVFNDQTVLPACNIIVPGFEKATLWCNVTGRSMEPKINPGDIIALRECSVNDIQYGEIYAVVLDTFRTIKIIRKGKSTDFLRFVPINISCFDEQEFHINRIIKIFEVIGSISKFF